jgi:hypothetical protein
VGALFFKSIYMKRYSLVFASEEGSITLNVIDGDFYLFSSAKLKSGNFKHQAKLLTQKEVKDMKKFIDEYLKKNDLPF